MIQKTITYSCRVCGSANIIKNGSNRLGQQQYHCKDCGVYRVLESRRETKKKQKSLVLKAYQERISLRGLSRLFGIHRLTIARWIGEHVAALPTLVSTLLPAQPDDVLEFDEAWSFVRKRRNKRWLWTVMCRRTRQFDDFLYWRCNGKRFRQKIFKSVAFVLGDRSEQSCRRLWDKVPRA